jgi:hypothetical protein
MTEQKPTASQNPAASQKPLKSNDPDADAIPGDGRHETQAERLDRNWVDLLQELRVTQTGTQILTGFLLTLAFQTRFATLDRWQITIYLALVVLSGLTTVLGVTPVALHRALFRKRAMAPLVSIADKLLRATLAGVALILAGITLFIFDVVVGEPSGLIAGSVALVITVILWLVIPVGIRPRIRD